MTRFKSLKAIGSRALEGSYESQDSQDVLRQYVTEYGIGVTSSSPPRPESPSSSRRRSRRTKRRRDSPSAFLSDPASCVASQPVLQSVPSTAPPATTGAQDALPQHNVAFDGRDKTLSLSVASPAVAAAIARGQDRSPDPQTTTACAAPAGPSDAANFCSPPVPNLHNHAIHEQPHAGPAPCTIDETGRPLEKLKASVNANTPSYCPPPPKKARKMDISQQSPTQNNDDRDYDNCFDPPSFVPTSPTSQDPPTEKQSHDDESGPVNFGNLSHLIQTDTQPDEEPSSIPDDVGLALSRGNWRRTSSQQHSSVPRTDGESPLPPTAPPPQTPAQPQNPFAGVKKLADPALVGSQLFGQTQFSSAVKHFSPTSSRPSPHVAHNSISPNVAETSPLKNRFNIASTPDLLSSSPQVIRARSAANGRACSPTYSGPPEDGTVPESPQFAPADARKRQGPLETYENMADSQKRRLNNGELEDNPSGEESDDMLNAIRRRRRAASKQAAASKELTSISVGRRSARESLEAPSSIQRPRRARARPNCYPVSDDTASEDEIDEITVADSQGKSAIQDSHSRPSPDLADNTAGSKPGLGSSSEAVPDSIGATQKSVPNGAIMGTDSSGNSSRPKDLIPETSPNNTQSHPVENARASSEDPLITSKAQAGDTSDVVVSEGKQDNGVEPRADEPAPSPPHPARRSSRKPRPTFKAQSLNAASHVKTDSEPKGTEAASPTDMTAETKEIIMAKKQLLVQFTVAQDPSNPAPELHVAENEPPLPSSPPIPKPGPTSVEPSGLMVENQSPGKKLPSTPDVRVPPPIANPPGSTSTLSVLTSTPTASNKTSPATQESVELPPLSPDPPRGRKASKSLPRVATGSKITKPATRRQSRRTIRLDSASTDELTRSPSVTGFENSIIQPPKNIARGSRLSMLSHTSKDSGTVKLFAGMVFAISFQSKREGEKADQYEHRLGHSRDVERLIVQSGGHLLANGFDELFESNSLMSRAASPETDNMEEKPLTLTSWAQSLGFTALIADGHSRKVKYMQALALGLPCVSDRWVTACVTKGVVVDWAPYLLCAGQSSLLGDAFRSRNLPPYPATEARLVDIIGQRPKMLEESNILLVMKKSRAEDKKMPYVFLAHVLGATLSRAHSLEEARETLRHREELNNPFDWVYVDENTGTEQELFSAPASAPKRSKKRKRPAASATDAVDQPPKRIRTLSNELVIQSLILGRMIEEGELEA